MPNTLIIGTNSIIGQALKSTLTQADFSVFATSRRKEDATRQCFHLDLADVSNFNITQPIDIVYLCAGITTVANCQNDSAYARVINVDAQVHLATYFLERGAHVVYLSSSAVFSGDKPKYRVTDTPCPITLYGEHKAEVEGALLALSGKLSIVRLTKVLTPEYPLILQWLAALRKNEPIYPFHDLYLSPVPLHEVVAFLKQVVEVPHYGVVHFSGEADVSYVEVAEYLAKLVGADRGLIVPRSKCELSDSVGGLPVYSSLEMTEARSDLVIPDLSFMTVMDGLYGGCGK